MTLAGDLDLPDFDFSDPDLIGETYHRRLAAVREQSWLARSPIALLVLDRAAGDFFLRSRSTAFPGRQIAELFGITAGPLFAHIDANILNLSDETHRRLRSIVGGAFTPVAAKTLGCAQHDEGFLARDEKKAHACAQRVKRRAAQHNRP